MPFLSLLKFLFAIFNGSTYVNNFWIVSKDVAKVNACKVGKFKPIQTHIVTATDFKIIRKVVHDHANEFLSNNKILHNYQSGFRTNHSTNLYLPSKRF